MNHLQKTIKESIELKGMGLHNGVKVNVCLKPSEVDSGIKFKRTDLENTKNIIEAKLYKCKFSNTLCKNKKFIWGISFYY